MNKSSTLAYGCLAALAMTGAFAESGSPGNNLADEPGSLTVYAPRVFRRPSDRKNEDVVYLSHRVSYAGLDLAMHADVLELRRRIVESAQTGCEQLAALSPLAELDTAACAREAIAEAMVRARKVVADAMAAHDGR